MRIRKLIACFLLVFTFCGFFTGCKKELVCTELGIPSAQRFQDGIRARCVWDMKLWNGKLYIGGGDYDDNTGPTDIWCYDFPKKEWTNSGSVPDESVLRFVDLGGTLVAPGIDPEEDWSMGNYYALEGDSWQIYRNIPNSIHNFDMIKFGERIFAGNGVEDGNSPISYSDDGGQTFLPLEIYKDGALFDTTGLGVIRTYEFFVLKGTLYAIIRYGVNKASYDVFKYENGVMNYYTDLTEKIEFNSITMNMFGAKVEFKNKIYFTTGYLYSSSDAISYEKIPVLEDSVVSDILVDDKTMYLLCTKEKGNFTYTLAIYKTTDGKDFKEVLTYDYSTLAMCFEKSGDTYYVGMGYPARTIETNGAVLEFTFK